MRRDQELLVRILLPSFALLCAGSLSSACSSAPADGPLPAIASASATREVTDGAARLTTVVDVRLDRTFAYAPRTLPLASLIEFAVPVPGGGERRVLVDRAEPAPDDPLVIRVTVKALIPAGAEVRLARKIFHRNEAGDIRALVESDLTALLAVLAAGPLIPADASLLAPGTAAEPRPEDRDPAAQRSALDASLQRRGVTPEVRTRALADYDSMPADVVPAPKLRAAIAAFSGTWAEPMVAAVLSGGGCSRRPIASVRYQPPPEGGVAFSRVTGVTGGKRAILLHPALEAERFELSMPFLIKEAIRCDRLSGRFEDIGVAAFQTYFYLGLLATSPDLAHSTSTATRDLNLAAIAMVNSGRRLPESVGVLQSEGVAQVLPGSTSPHSSFAALIAAGVPPQGNAESPDEELAQSFVAALAAAAEMPPGSAFNLRYLDELLSRAIDPPAYLAALKALTLAPLTN